MLKLAGEFEVGREKTELITYSPDIKDTGDLEAATKTINLTAEASGVGNADYSASLTLPKPGDARLSVLRIAARLAVTIDTIPVNDTNLYCRVYVDAQDANHRLFDLSWNSTGQKLAVVDTHSANLSTIFNALKDGAVHNFYFFFWKAGTGTGIVISEVRLWEGVGTYDTGGGTPSAKITHSGFLGAYFKGSRVGTGSASFKFSADGVWRDESPNAEYKLHLITQYLDFIVYGTVATDLNYIVQIFCWLRSEQ